MLLYCSRPRDSEVAEESPQLCSLLLLSSLVDPLCAPPFLFLGGRGNSYPCLKHTLKNADVLLYMWRLASTLICSFQKVLLLPGRCLVYGSTASVGTNPRPRRRLRHRLHRLRLQPPRTLALTLQGYTSSWPHLRLRCRA